MTPTEFNTTFLPDVWRRMPELRDWVNQLDADEPDEAMRRRKPIATAIIVRWREALEDVTTFEASAVVGGMTTGEYAPLGKSVNDREMFGATVRSFVLQRRFATDKLKGQVMQDRIAERYDGKGAFADSLERFRKTKSREVAYKCLQCYDTGFVYVIHPSAITRFMSVPGYEMERDAQRDLPVACAACDLGDKHKNFPRYDATKMVRWDLNESKADNLDRLRKWVERKLGEHLEEKNKQMEHRQYTEKEF